MRSQILVGALALLLASCSTADQKNDGQPQTDAVTCACQLGPSPASDPAYQALLVPWDCYCSPDASTCQASNPARCQFATRVDYPDCGMTVLSFDSLGVNHEVRDPAGNSIGVELISDTSPYKCPGNPSLTSNLYFSGRYPDPSCSAVTCADPCYAGPFPCPPAAADGGATD